MCSCNQSEFYELYKLAFHPDVQLRGTDSEIPVPARLDHLRKLKSGPLNALLDAAEKDDGDGSSTEGDSSSGPEDGVKLPGTRRAIQLLVQSLYDEVAVKVLPNDDDTTAHEALMNEEFDEMPQNLTHFIELATALEVPDKVTTVCANPLECLQDDGGPGEIKDSMALFVALERGAQKACEIGNIVHRSWWSENVDLAASNLMSAVEAEAESFESTEPGPDMEGFHPRITCDKSGVVIVGTRYQLKEHDYDLCAAEYSKLSTAEKAKYEAIEPTNFRRASTAIHPQDSPITMQPSLVRSLTLDQLAALVKAHPAEVAKLSHELDLIEQTIVLKPGFAQVIFSGQFGDGTPRKICLSSKVSAENKKLDHLSMTAVHRGDNRFSGRLTLVHPRDASQSRVMDFVKRKGNNMFWDITGSWLELAPKAMTNSTDELEFGPTAAAEASTVEAAPFVQQLIDAGLAEADKEPHTAKLTFRLTMTEHQSTQRLQLLRKWAELQPCPHPCLAAPPPRPVDCEEADARAQAPGLLALLLHFEQLLPPPEEKDRRAGGGAFAPQELRASQLRTTFLDEALFVHASQPSMLQALLRQPDAAQLPAELLSGILSARTSHNTAEQEGELLEVLRGWSAAHTTDELARVVPSLQLEVLPLEALRRHAQPAQDGLFKAASGHAGLRRALCAKVLPVESRLATQDDEEPPPSLTCPISLDLMKDPVVASDGFTYEKASMTKFFAALKPGDGHGRSPLTHAPLTSRTLVPSHTVKTLVGEYKERCKRPRPQASAETLVMEALLHSSSTSSPKKPRIFGTECTNAGGRGGA